MMSAVELAWHGSL